ncbi:hypothetical protein OSH11_00735 [Kaistia dalseonensis]|uniref:ABC-type uncharacterized transport system permease subunit n=1 Tax=Kaistia dalseonensis TaxID=410840 RepID=A0ABU0H1Y3_9HYPH|nr:hypothetical protein [Kaistia dalseonensis]MCX5493220.1 hypothetical protein [Kaistia dalseonensis]MDQ0435775.1 ABC-type uncharacterized transport system permease subunit [Kaistia dalseonensis]
MIVSAVIAVVVGLFTRSFWLAFVSGLAASFVAALTTWALYSDVEGFNDYQFRTILAGFLSGALGMVIAFLRSAYDDYRLEMNERRGLNDGMRIQESPKVDRVPVIKAALRGRFLLLGSRVETFNKDVNDLTFNIIDRWVHRRTVRDDRQN